MPQDLNLYVESLPERIRARQTNRALAHLERQTMLRLASVQAEGLVQATKLHEIDHLAGLAMIGQAELHLRANVLAADDPFLADDLKLFRDLAKLGKSEIISDTIVRYCREGR